jgi:hypothetical protein
MKTTTITIKGEAHTRNVWLNGKELSPIKSQKVWNHSPDGFNWGYGGSGPAQLALAICLEVFLVNSLILILLFKLSQQFLPSN